MGNVVPPLDNGCRICYNCLEVARYDLGVERWWRMGDSSAVTVGVRLYGRQVEVLEKIDHSLGGVGRSAVLRRLIDEYVELEEVRNVVEAHQRGFLSAADAGQAFVDILEGNGDGAEEECPF